MNPLANATDAVEIARRWCDSKGKGWSLLQALGQGGTAPVFEVASPNGLRALKIYDLEFSIGDKGDLELKRIQQQLQLGDHSCPYLVRAFDGGRFEGRLFLLMDRALGAELEKKLTAIPRTKIRNIVNQVAQAAIFLRERNLCHRDIKAANIFISDDFEHCTLLDISVVRDISDPLGIGTDHGGGLPVVATARYSPPEYLFRLIDPTSTLWHALNIYQLGALLHDLIMREPLFQSEYKNSKQNRYRFAWIVATAIPVIAATDVDQDLVLLAQRALDKDWRKRSNLQLEDFLSDAVVQQKHALQLLGLETRPSDRHGGRDLAAEAKRIRDISQSLDDSIVDYLKGKGLIVKHEQGPGQDDSSGLVTFEWKLSSSQSYQEGAAVKLEVSISRTSHAEGARFNLSIRLSVVTSTRQLLDAMELPEIVDEASAEQILSQQAIASFESLALKIMRVRAQRE